MTSIWLVAEREISTKLRSRSFLISAGLMLVLAFGGVLVAGFISSSGGFGGPTKVAVVGERAVALDSGSFTVTRVADRATAERLVLDGEVAAAVVPGGDSAVGLTVLAAENVPVSLVQALSAAPAVELLAPVTDNPFLTYLMGLAFGMLFMFGALTYGMMIAQSVVEEKQTRIIEVLLATVTARTMLAGKILGNSVLALGQVAAVVVFAWFGMLMSGQQVLADDLGATLFWFVLLFAAAFVLLAAMFAALASLVSRHEDLATVVSPMIYLVFLPYLVVIFASDNLLVLAIMSYVPFATPVGMPMRLYLGAAAWWEPVLALLVLLVCIWLVWWLGARIYEASVLRTGARIKMKDAFASTA